MYWGLRIQLAKLNMTVHGVLVCLKIFFLNQLLHNGILLHRIKNSFFQKKRNLYV